VRRSARIGTLALLVALTAPACSRGGGAEQAAVPFVQVDPKSASPTDRAISKAQGQLRKDEDDPDAQLALAQAFLQKARETADPKLYTKADTLLGLVAKKAPTDPRVLVSQGSLLLARHQFADGLAVARKALRYAPDDVGAYGLVVDACNELGRYGEAAAATQRMVDIRPDLSSLSRVSYARELHGDLDGAITAMQQAVTAASSSTGENVAYVQVLLGNLLLTRGDLDGAERSYAGAEHSFPHLPAAQAGRAKALVALGEYGRAAKVLTRLVDVQPLPEYAIALGDARAASGDRAGAQEAYALVGVIAQLFRANGVNVDLEIALFDADHHPGPAAVAAARKALVDRPSILGHDVLAWNLHRAGKDDEAREEMAKALATGSRDPLIRFHAAAIADAMGDRAAAVEDLRIVLGSNPRFSAALADDVAGLAAHLGLEMPPPQHG
jgi:tetratricopeptide (TPR) repeat protein